MAALRLFGYLVVIAWSALTFLPLLWMLVSSFKTPAELTAHRWLLIPLHPTLQNYRDVLAGSPVARYVLNSIIVTLASLVLTFLVAFPAAYALAKYRIVGKAWLTRGILLSLAVPIQALVVPIWAMENAAGLTGTYWAVILPYVGMTLPGALLLLTAYLKSFPADIQDAAMVDGCNRLQVMLRIVLPMSRGPLVAIGILMANGFWTEYMFALVLLPVGTMQTLAVGIVNFSNSYYTPVNMILAALTLAIAPVLVAYAFLQRDLTNANIQLAATEESI